MKWIAAIAILVILGGPVCVAIWRSRHPDNWEQWRPRRKPGYDPDPQWLPPEDEP